MIDIRNQSVYGWREAIRGMRNSWNSWERSDSIIDEKNGNITLGFADYELMKKLASAHPSHAKYRRMITVYCNITAPMYWWKEFDTYKVGTVSNSQSSMHTITKRDLTIDDFSTEHLHESSIDILKGLIQLMNHYAHEYVESKNKEDWWQIIQLLPSSFNQTRTIMLNYEVLSNIYENRKDHKLDEWRKFCDWIENLPHSNLITGKEQAGHCAG